MKKQEVKEPKRIYVEYNESESGGELLEPEERWSSRADTIKEVEFLRLHRAPPENRFFYDSIELVNDDLLKLDHLFLAVVRYSTGDTFGHTEGAWALVGVAPTYEIAKLMLEEATKPAEKGDYKNYRAWEGYFESLTDTEIHELRVV